MQKAWWAEYIIWATTVCFFMLFFWNCREKGNIPKFTFYIILFSEKDSTTVIIIASVIGVIALVTVMLGILVMLSVYMRTGRFSFDYSVTRHSQAAYPHSSTAMVWDGVIQHFFPYRRHYHCESSMGKRPLTVGTFRHGVSWGIKKGQQWSSALFVIENIMLMKQMINRYMH